MDMRVHRITPLVLGGHLPAEGRTKRGRGGMGTAGENPWASGGVTQHSRWHLPV